MSSGERKHRGCECSVHTRSIYNKKKKTIAYTHGPFTVLCHPKTIITKNANMIVHDSDT